MVTHGWYSLLVLNDYLCLYCRNKVFTQKMQPVLERMDAAEDLYQISVRLRSVEVSKSITTGPQRYSNVSTTLTQCFSTQAESH